MANITDWLTFDYISGGPGYKAISASTSANDTERNRTALVNFENIEGLKKEVTVIQYRDVQNELPVLNPTGATVYKSGGTGMFYFTYDYPFYIPTMENYRVTASTSYSEYYHRYECNWQVGEYDSPYGRNINVDVVTPYGTVHFPIQQLSYNPSITFNPTALTFNTASGGSGQVTVTSLDLPWSATSNDDWITLSQYTGAAGDTIITVSAAPLNDIDLVTCYEKKGSVTFTNGDQSADFYVTVKNDMIGSIDDDWVTCTYYITETGDTTLCYCFDDLSEGTYPSQTFTPYQYVFMDNDHGTMQKTAHYTASHESYIFKYHATFTTTGEHIVKFRFSSAEAIPARAFPSNNLVYYLDSCFNLDVNTLKKVVIGDRCKGYIGAYAVNNPNVEEIILGRADHLIYCKAFASAGSLNHNFILTSGATIEEVCGDVEAFGGFKADMFIIQQDLTGGIDYGTSTANYERQLYWYKEYPGDTAHSDTTKLGLYTATTFTGAIDKHFYGIICNYFVFGQNCYNVGSYATYRYQFLADIDGVTYENPYNPYRDTRSKWLLYGGVLKMNVGAFVFLRKNAPTIDDKAFGESGSIISMRTNVTYEWQSDYTYRSVPNPFPTIDYWYPTGSTGYADNTALQKLNTGHTFSTLSDITGQ